MKSIIIIYVMLLSLNAKADTVAVLESKFHPGHARNIVNIIGKKDVKLYLTQLDNDEKYVKALNKIANGDEVIVNLSLQGCTFNEAEYSAIKLMTKRGKIVIVAAGNKNAGFEKCDKIFPAAYNIKGMVVVADNDGHKMKADIIVIGSQHCYIMCMSGSSQATAKITRLVLDRFKKGESIINIRNKIDKN